MDPDIVSDETPMPKEVNPDDVAGEVSLQLCEGVGNPDLGGLFVPTLPPFGAGDATLPPFGAGDDARYHKMSTECYSDR